MHHANAVKRWLTEGEEAADWRLQSARSKRTARKAHASKSFNTEEPLLRREGEHIRVQRIHSVKHCADRLRAVNNADDPCGARTREDLFERKDASADPADPRDHNRTRGWNQKFGDTRDDLRITDRDPALVTRTHRRNAEPLAGGACGETPTNRRVLLIKCDHAVTWLQVNGNERTHDRLGGAVRHRNKFKVCGEHRGEDAAKFIHAHLHVVHQVL